MSRKNKLILIGIAILLVICIVAGIIATSNKTTVPSASPLTNTTTQTTGTNATTDTTANDVDADFSDLNLGNLSVLKSVYSQKTYLFIDQQTLNYANNYFGQYSGFTIDTTSFSKRDASSYQFMVRDSNDNRLFYTIIHTLPNDQVSLEFYNI